MVEGKTYYLEYNLFFEKNEPISFVATLRKFSPNFLSNIPIIVYINGINNFSARLLENYFGTIDNTKIFIEEIDEMFKVTIRTLNSDPVYENYYLSLESISERTKFIKYDYKIVISDTLPVGGILIKYLKRDIR